MAQVVNKKIEFALFAFRLVARSSLLEIFWTSKLLGSSQTMSGCSAVALSEMWRRRIYSPATVISDMDAEHPLPFAIFMKFFTKLNLLYPDIHSPAGHRDLSCKFVCGHILQSSNSFHIWIRKDGRNIYVSTY